MSLCVVAFPTVSESELHWLQTVRAKFDPQHEEIAPHVTFMFPSKSFELHSLEDHVRGVVSAIPSFTVIFRCVIPYRGHFDARSHLFMVPDEGFSSVVHIHNQLYSGGFGHGAAVDVPFIPHMTIGVFDDPTVCRTTAYELNSRNIEITASVEKLSIVAGEGQAIVHGEINLT